MRTAIMLIAFVSLGVLLPPELCRADLIRFKDDIELGGEDVQVLSRKDGRVVVKVVYGTVTLNADRIAVIKIDFAKRVESLVAEGKDTPNNLFDLGVLCDQNQMPKEAAEAYVLTLRKEQTPPEMLRRLAAIFEERHMWPEAKAAYDRMLLTNPADEFLQKKAAFCEGMAKDAPPFTVNVKIGDQENTVQEPEGNNQENEPEANQDDHEPDQQPDNEPEPPKKRDGFEANPLWRVEQWGNAATCEVVVQEEDPDNKILNVTWTQQDKDKVAVRLNVDIDLTDKTKVTLDVFNMAEKPASVGVAFNTLPGYQFFESAAFNSRVQKWVPVEIDVASRKFKCAATNWRHSAEIANKDNVKDIFLLIYNRDDRGTLFIDNVRFHTAEGGD